MVRAELLGAHSHRTLCGVTVHIWKRRDNYLARGRIDGAAFGHTLGCDTLTATSRLRHLLGDIESGAFIRPSERVARSVGEGRPARLTLRQLIAEFIAEKRKVRGRKTGETYKSRLLPVLDFAELPASQKRWRLALDIDREFVVALRAFLFAQNTTRNGRLGGVARPLSARQIVNILQCLRGALAWARRGDVRKLPADWANPLTPDLVGAPPAKDPLREDKLPLSTRVMLVDVMDGWQLSHLALSLVLPLRPEEAAGLLVTDVDFDKCWLSIGTRFNGGDFTKARTSFKLPFPDALKPLLAFCVGSRSEGPLLSSRKAFEGPRGASGIGSAAPLQELYERELQASRTAVQAEQDRKAAFRGVLKKVGGVSTDRMAAEFKKVLADAGVVNGASLYTLRAAVTTAMNGANLPHLEMRYLTGHSTSDILNDYATLDPVRAMGMYFGTIRPLLDAITRRASELGLLG
jgi:hypothetical protein